MTQGLKKYENQVSKAVQKPTLNPYNNQPIEQKLSPITPLVKKAVEPILKPIGISAKPAQESSKGIFTDASTPNEKAPVNALNQATAPKIETKPVQVSKFEPQKTEPTEVSKPDFYGVQQEHKVYDPYKSAKRIEDLDPETQAVIKKTFSKENLFGEDGFQYNMESVANAVATLPNKMVQTVGFIANTAKRITEYIPGNTFLKSKDVLELEEEGLKAFRETQIVRDRSQQIQQKYNNKIGAIPKFTSDVLTNAIDMIPMIVLTQGAGSMAGMSQMFFSAGAQAEKEALDSGAEADEAFVYGVFSGGIEAGTEMIFGTLGGIKVKNMPAWSQVLSNKFKEVLADVSKTPIAKAFVSNLVDVAGEGFEEVVAELLGNYAKLVYTDQIKSGEELTNDMLYAGLLGMFSAGFMRTSQIASIRALEQVANTGSIKKMSHEQSVTLSRSLADKLNYNFELLSKEQAIEKYGSDASVKQNLLEGGRAFVVKQTTENGRLGDIVVIEDGTKRNVLATSVLHEVTHVFEDTSVYNQLIALVKQRLGDVRYKQFVDNYAQAYKVDTEATYRSGVRMSESEFIAQEIIQKQLFGLDGNMRTSFIMDLAGQKPSLFRKMTDNIDEFLTKMKYESLDPKKPEDKAMLEYLQYMENLKNIFKQANFEYQGKGFEAFEQVGYETKMQKAIKEALDFDIDAYEVFIPEQERLNDASYSNFILATTLKPLQRDIKLTFNLSEKEMQEIYETLYEMNSFENNAVNQLFDIINSQMDGRFDYLTEDNVDDLTNEQFETLGKFLVQSKQYFNNRRWMDEIIRDTNEKFIEKRKVESIEFSEDYTIEEWRLHFARQEVLKFMQNNPAVLIGSGGSKDLIVLHNTTEEKLLKTIALGGFPMPSLAVTRAKYAHSSFGDITIVFNKDVLKNSPTFTADAYSPRVPTINNMFVESKDIKAFESFISKYKSMDGYYYLQQYVSALKNGNMRDANSFLDEAFKLDYEIKENVISFKTTELYRAYYEEIFGKKFVKDFKFDGGMGTSYSDIAMERRMEKSDMMDRFLSDNGAKPYFRNNVDPYTNNGRKSPSKLYTEATLQNIVKYMSSRNNIVGAETSDDFNLWKHKALLNNVMLNVSDVQQNRRMIKKMDERDYQSFIGSRQYLLETIYREVEENALTEKFPIKNEFVYELEKYLERKTDVSKEALIKYFEPKGFLISKEILTYFSDLQDNAYGLENENGINPYESFTTYAEYLSQVLTDVKGLSVSYFESKPRRAVMFEEIEQVLIPKNSSEELKESLKENGIPFTEYQKSHIFDDAYGRQPLIEAMKEYQFQLAPDFNSDSNGLELNEDQLRPIMLSRALDADGNIKLSKYNGREGYFDIRRPLDTRKRNVRAMAEDFAQRYDMEFDGLFNAKDAKTFLSLATSNGYDFDGILFKDGTEVGYVPAMDSQFFPADSIEFTGKLLKEMKDRTGIYEDLDKQVQDAKRSADLQIIQANLNYYEEGFNAYERLNMSADALLAMNEEFKEMYEEAVKRAEEYELDNVERRNKMFVEQGMSAEYIEEFNKDIFESLEADKQSILEELYDRYIEDNQKPFYDDYANYKKWQDIKALHEGFAPEPFVDARGFKQYPISDYEIAQGRERFHIPVLSQYEAQQVIDKTIENMQKTSRYAEDFEMVDPKTLILFKDYDRLSRPSYQENFKAIFDSIREKGFIEPVWITANYQTGFTYLGEGNHRVYVALMAGIDRVPAVVSRHNYDEPRLIERQGYAIGLSNGGYVDVNGIQKQDSMMKPSELSDVFKFQRELTPEFEAFYKDVSPELKNEDGSIKTLYHGTREGGFNIFNYEPKKQTGTDYGEAYYFSSNKEVANGYAYDFRKDDRVTEYTNERNRLFELFRLNPTDENKKNYQEFKKTKDLYELLNGLDENGKVVKTEGSEVKEVYLNLKNPLVVDAGGEYYYKVYDKYFEEARKNGNDGIVIKNVIDVARGEHKPSDIYVAFNKNQIKRTDNLYPTSSPDIRFQLNDDIYISSLNLLNKEYEESYKEYLLFDLLDGVEAYNSDLYNFKDYVDDYVNEEDINLDEAINELWNDFRVDSKNTLESDYSNYLKNEDKIKIQKMSLNAINSVIESLPNADNVSRSNKSVSTYLTYKKEAYNEVLETLKTVGNVNVATDFSDIEGTFTVRLSDHETGSYRDEMTGDIERYEDADISVIVQFQKGFESLLTPEEQSELNELRENDRIRPFETSAKDMYRMKVLSEKEGKYVKYKKLMDIKHYDDVQNEYRKARRALNENTDDVDRKTLNSILNNVKGYRGTDRRTKVEWMFIANQYGANYNAKSQDDLLQHALMTWMILIPYKNLNKQSDSSVKLSVDEWIREVGKGAGAGQIRTVAELGGVPEVEVKKPLDFTPEGDNERIRSYVETAYGEVDGVSQKRLEEAVRDGSFTYASYSDKVSVKQGNKRIADNGAEAEFSNLKYNFLNNTMPTKSDIATAEILIKHFSKNRETEKVVELITIVADMGTQLGQAVQALSLIKRLSPTGQLVSLQRIVKKMETLYSNDNTQFKINVPNEYVDELMEIEGKIGELNDNIAEQELLQNTIQGFIDEKTELENSLDSGIFDRYEKVKQEVADIRKKIAERDMLRKKVDKYETELLLHRNYAKDIDTLRAQREELEIKIKSAQKAIREGTAQEAKIANLEAELKELQAKIPADIIDRIEATKESIKSIKEQLKILKKHEDRLKSLTTKEVIDEKLENIKKAIAEQLPVTFVDQLNAWRYLSMLGNPRTHIRNILGNAGFMPTYLMNDVVGSVIEKFLPKEQRTKALNALSDPELKDFVLQLYEQDKNALESSTKYSNVTYEIDKQRRIFGWKWLENLREKNFEWLEKEDKWFSKPAYMHALGSIVKARGWDILEMTEEQVIEARKYAIEFARKATYRDASKVADDLNRLERGWGAFGKFMMASILPFKKTPINILKRGVEYTPVSIMVGVKQLAFDVRRNDITPAQALDKITSGLTGTGIMLVGAWLFSIGVLSVGDDDDEKDRKRFYDRALGSQRYALNWDGHSYTIDWLVPTALPLILGGELARAFSKENDDTFINSLTDATLGILDPVFELSMLQGVTQTLQSYQSGAGTFADVIATASANYVGQLLPTLGGQIARIIDPVQRSTISSKESPIGKFAEQTLRKLANKVPLLSMINAPVVNVRGEDVVNYENPFARTFMNLISPGFYKNGTLTEQDNEILRMYEKTMDTAVIPKTLDKSFDYEKKTYYLDNRQYSDMSRILGEVSYEQLDKLFDHKGYKRIAEEDKVFMIDKMYDYAYFKAKDAILKGMGKSFESDEYNNMKKAEANGVNVIDYLLAKREFDKMSSDKFKSKQEKFIEYLKKSGYSNNMKFFMEVVGKYKYNPFSSSGGIFN